MERRHLESQVLRLSSIGWLKGSGFWQAAAKITPPRVRPLIRRALIRRPGTTRMDTSDRRYLLDFYRGDTLKLASLLDRSLDGWLRQD